MSRTTREKIIDTLTRTGKPMSTAEIAAVTPSPIGGIRSQLASMQKAGILAGLPGRMAPDETIKWFLK